MPEFADVLRTDVDGNYKTGYGIGTNVYTRNGLAFYSRSIGACVNTFVDVNGLTSDLYFNATAVDQLVTWISSVRVTEGSLNLSVTASVRLLAGAFVNRTVTTRGVLIAGDGGGGSWFYDSTDTTSPDNTGTIIVAADGKRWKRVFSGAFNVRWFGAKGDGIANDTVAFQAAIDAAAGKTLLADGIFLLTNPVQLAANSEYDFVKATFVAGTGCGSWTIYAIGRDNIVVWGGNVTYRASVTPLDLTHTNGVYSTGSGFYFENCVNISAFGCGASQQFTGLNFYNCRSCREMNGRWIDCAACVACVANAASSGTVLIDDILFSGSQMISCGDDGVALLARGGDVRNVRVIGNYITKTQRANGSLTAATDAGTGIRLGQFVTPGRIFDCIITGNNGVNMVEDFIRVLDATRCQITNNNVSGYARRVSQAYQFGIATKGLIDCTISGNISSGPVTASKAFVFDDLANCEVTGNKALVSIAGEACARFDNTTLSRITGNTFGNTLAYGIQLASTTTKNMVLGNDVTVFSGLGIFDQSAAGANQNTVQRNRGHTTENTAADTILAAASSKVVNHGIVNATASRVRVRINPRTTMSSATSCWVDTITATQFTVRTNVNPTAVDFTFQWEAFYE